MARENVVVRTTEWNQGESEASTFPIQALPAPIRRFVTECAESLTAAPELVAIPSLVVTAAAIGNTRRIQLKPGWTEPPILFGAVVSASGTMKSPALEKAVEPIQRLGSSKHRTWTGDVTVERLARLLQDNPRGLVLIRDELSGWVKSMNQYKGGKGADRQFYLSVWSGAAALVDRVGTGTPTTISVPQPCLSVVGCLPPDVLPVLDDEGGREDGFLPRLLFAWPEPVAVRWTETVVSDDARNAYGRLIETLFSIPLDKSPVCLPLTPEAHEQFVTWHDRHCIEGEHPNLSPFVQAVYSKLKGYCPRLALIHALATDPAAKEVDVESIKAAIELVGYFKGQAAKVGNRLCRFVGAREVKVERCKQEIRQKLAGGKVVNKRDLQKNSQFAAKVFNPAWESMRRPELIEVDGGVCLGGIAPLHRHTDTGIKGGVVSSPGGLQSHK